MPDQTKAWVSIERQFLREELQYYKAGSKLISPSGQDITAEKISQLESRIEHANKLADQLDQIDNGES